MPKIWHDQGREARDYYDREAAVHLDGSLIFQSAADRHNEENVARKIEEHWKCRVASFGALSPIDWYAERKGRLVGLLELKSRPHEHDRFDTVFLNVRKWLALSLGQVGLGCPAIFVVRFSDGIWWLPISKIDASRHIIGGCMRIVKNSNDIEPVIEVLISEMRCLQSEKESYT